VLLWLRHGDSSETEEGECLPFEAVTRRLVKTVTEDTSVCVCVCVCVTVVCKLVTCCVY
jgi:hypothetical protein